MIVWLVEVNQIILSSKILSSDSSILWSSLLTQPWRGGVASHLCMLHSFFHPLFFLRSYFAPMCHERWCSETGTEDTEAERVRIIKRSCVFTERHSVRNSYHARSVIWQITSLLKILRTCNKGFSYLERCLRRHFYSFVILRVWVRRTNSFFLWHTSLRIWSKRFKNFGISRVLFFMSFNLFIVFNLFMAYCVVKDLNSEEMFHCVWY